MDEITKLMVEQLKDAYSAERQALRIAPKMMKNASNEKLKQGFQMHIEQTEGQVQRIEQALEQLGAKPGRKVCEAMRGLIEEAQHEMEEHEKGPLMDVVIIAAAQRIEHYEISAYGTMATLAKSAGHADLGELLGQSLDEEKRMDEELSRIAESEVNPAFIQHARGEGEEESANENRRGGGRRKAS
jgi:ferritin-like metal-binding protein YciE